MGPGLAKRSRDHSEILHPPRECFPRILSSGEPEGAVPSQEVSLCLADGDGTVGKGSDISMGRPHPGKGPGAWGPCFYPASWSLAGNIHLLEGGTVTVDGGDTTQSGLWLPMRQPSPCLRDKCWLPFSDPLRPDVFLGSRAFGLSGDRAPFSSFQVIVDLEAPILLRAITSQIGRAHV